MKKVYFDKDEKRWMLEDLVDLYTFKYINIITNDEHDAILSWHKTVDRELTDIAEDERLYGAEIMGEEYLFVESYSEGKFFLDSKDRYHLERLVRDYNFIFVGEELNKE
jgi:hypothetical protein